MNLTRREFHRLLLAGGLIGAGLSTVGAAPALQEGSDWSQVNPPQPGADSQVER
ncbi:MAG: hypothetical protein Q8M20_15270 [Rhodocyclaceae bacterium]|nr:hypothetical protein [Rhodocyclaceae bacterium]MDZ4215135.1 hypothetical protein [Rhodocyclaceae bacterium]